tara:strand:+ start:2419 stop:2610 length:192 start_codon:yes stop_codon:yes gene_type:complete
MILKIGKFRINILEEIKPSVASAVAAIISYIENDSVLWALFHYFCGLFYIVYWAIKKILFWIF